MRQSCTRRLSSSINGESTVLNRAKESRPNRVVYSEEPPKIEQKCNKNGERHIIGRLNRRRECPNNNCRETSSRNVLAKYKDDRINSENNETRDKRTEGNHQSGWNGIWHLNPSDFVLIKNTIELHSHNGYKEGNQDSLAIKVSQLAKHIPKRYFLRINYKHAVSRKRNNDWKKHLHFIRFGEVIGNTNTNIKREEPKGNLIEPTQNEGILLVESRPSQQYSVGRVIGYWSRINDCNNAAKENWRQYGHKSITYGL